MPADIELHSFNIPCRIKHIIPNYKGKITFFMGHIYFIELNKVFPLMSYYLPDELMH